MVPSDARLKRDIRFETTLENGIRVYSFRYWNDARRFEGVLAQDLLADPRFRAAVRHSASGYYVVDLGALGLDISGARGAYLAAARHALEAAGNAAVD